MKVLLHVLFIAMYVLVLFFGLGPVIFADGSDSERMWTLVAVLAILAAIIAVHSLTVRRLR